MHKVTDSKVVSAEGWSVDISPFWDLLYEDKRTLVNVGMEGYGTRSNKCDVWFNGAIIEPKTKAVPCTPKDVCFARIRKGLKELGLKFVVI